MLEKFYVPTAKNMKTNIFWDVAPWSLVDYRRFGGAYSHYLHDDEGSNASLKRRPVSTRLYDTISQKTIVLNECYSEQQITFIQLET